MNESSSSSHHSVAADGDGQLMKLPDWSGHQPHRSKVTNDEWRAYCRANLSKIYSRPEHRARHQAQHGIAVEFNL